MTKIYGNTYPVREQLKAIGAKWNKEEKAWYISLNKVGEAKRIVEGAGKAPQRCGNARQQTRPRGRADSAPAQPAPMAPVTDCKAETEKHGRVAALTDTAIFDRVSSKAEPSTLGQTFWGKQQGKRYRFLIVRETAPFYLSASYLEDMDEFQKQPGYYRQVTAIAVEPTAEEIANDPAVAKAKAEALSNRRREITRTVQQALQETSDTRLNAHIAKHPTTGMVRVWGEVRMGGSEQMFTDGKKLIYVTSSYDDGPAVWALENDDLATEAMGLKTDAKI